MNKLYSGIIIFILLFVLGARIEAASLNEIVNFNIDKDYDISGRDSLKTILVKISPKLYFYIEKEWWDEQNSQGQNGILSSLSSLASEFETKIYRDLTSLFGSEWNPGIDGDSRINLIFHSMRSGVGGYFRSVDEYPKIQSPDSNEKEIIYLNVENIKSSNLKSLLAHEFAHLITFNQKDRQFGVSDEVWLNEARAEYAITFLGYDDNYEGSNLQRRVKEFLENPQDSLAEWQGKKHDYGVANLFIQYLVDYYGKDILADSLKSKLTGILSLNEAFQKKGIDEDFAQIFTNWTIAVLINSCELGSKYCYLNNNLKNIKINPSLNFLPSTGKSSLSVANATKNWAGNWHRIVGGNSVLKLEFTGVENLHFSVPYLVEDRNGSYFVNFLQLDENQKGEIYVSDFGSQKKSLTIMPSLQTKGAGFDGQEESFPFTFVASIVERTPEQETERIKELLAQIEVLKKEIDKIRQQIAILLGRTMSCEKIKNNLYFGMMDNSEVRCLQDFLRTQGAGIYPEGLVTGNFLGATRTAVIRFQEKYKEEILAPLGLESGTGIVGPKTREKINQILE